MKPGGSSLNPYATAYVPLSKRQGDDSLRSPKSVQQQPYGYGGTGTQMSVPKMKDEDLEMDMDMDIEYLMVTFSGLSHESISNVYLANNGDLDATIEMLTQLEIYSYEAQEHLPYSLDIGDVPETTTVPSKQKNASSEASGSSSGTHKGHVSTT